MAAALYPPDDMVVTESEYREALNNLKSFDELDENPLTKGNIRIPDKIPLTLIRILMMCGISTT